MIKQFFESFKNLGIDEILAERERRNIDLTSITTDNFKQNCLFYLPPLKNDDKAAALAKAFIDLGANASFVDGLSQTALFYAARDGMYKLCDLLIEHGCDPLHVDTYGQTAFYYACREGHLKILELLVSKGAEPDMQD